MRRNIYCATHASHLSGEDAFIEQFVQALSVIHVYSTSAEAKGEGLTKEQNKKVAMASNRCRELLALRLKEKRGDK